MKIVINRCHGGFGLSPTALHWLHARGCEGIATPVKEYYGPKWNDKASEDLKAWNKWWKDLNRPRENPIFMTVFSLDEQYVLNDSGVKRDDPLLIRCINELGVEEVNGRFAELVIVEVPDYVGSNWYIHDYDGAEAVHENHQSWS